MRVIATVAVVLGTGGLAAAAILLATVADPDGGANPVDFVEPSVLLVLSAWLLTCAVTLAIARARLTRLKRALAPAPAATPAPTTSEEA